jgi:hypothetical protein
VPSSLQSVASGAMSESVRPDAATLPELLGRLREALGVATTSTANAWPKPFSSNNPGTNRRWRICPPAHACAAIRDTPLRWPNKACASIRDRCCCCSTSVPRCLPMATSLLPKSRCRPQLPSNPYSCSPTFCLAPEARTWQEGRCLVFDDSYVHEAWSRSAHTCSAHSRSVESGAHASRAQGLDSWHHRTGRAQPTARGDDPMKEMD